MILLYLQDIGWLMLFLVGSYTHLQHGCRSCSLNLLCWYALSRVLMKISMLNKQTLRFLWIFLNIGRFAVTNNLLWAKAGSERNRCFSLLKSDCDWIDLFGDVMARLAILFLWANDHVTWHLILTRAFSWCL